MVVVLEQCSKVNRFRLLVNSLLLPWAFSRTHFTSKIAGNFSHSCSTSSTRYILLLMSLSSTYKMNNLPNEWQTNLSSFDFKKSLSHCQGCHPETIDTAYAAEVNFQGENDNRATLYALLRSSFFSSLEHKLTPRIPAALVANVIMNISFYYLEQTSK